MNENTIMPDLKPIKTFVPESQVQPLSVTLPLGYVAIPLDEYREMTDKLARINADMADEIHAATEKAHGQIAALQVENEKLRGQVDILARTANEQSYNIKKLEHTLENEKADHAAVLKRNTDLTEMAHNMNETIYDLRREIAELNNELLATDEIHEIPQNNHAVHQED